MLRVLLVLAIFLFSLNASHTQFDIAKSQVEERWQTFQSNRKFREFKPGKSDAQLKEEFEEICKIRSSIWKEAIYKRAEHLIAEDLVRAPGCAAFHYNNTVPYYNASTIFLGDRTYIACEGPRSKDIPAFFRLLASQGITHLVRLTGSFEGWSKKCHPYWDGYITESEGNHYLNIPTDTGIYSLRAFQMDDWRDHQGIDPNALLKMTLETRKSLGDGLLLAHCSAGVGRTGTFLAALAILDALENGAPLSIEELVYRLSLQRIHTVAKPAQYITLHRMAELYLRKMSF